MGQAGREKVHPLMELLLLFFRSCLIVAEFVTVCSVRRWTAVTGDGMQICSREGFVGGEGFVGMKIMKTRRRKSREKRLRRMLKEVRREDEEGEKNKRG